MVDGGAQSVNNIHGDCRQRHGNSSVWPLVALDRRRRMVDEEDDKDEKDAEAIQLHCC